MNLILDGAREHNLDANYIENLAKHPTYSPPKEIIEKRSLLPSPDTLPKISYTVLKEMGYSDGKTHLAVLGYVFALPVEKIFLTEQVGNDNTARLIKWLHNQPTDGENDDEGKPPYPDEAKMTKDEKE